MMGREPPWRRRVHVHVVVLALAVIVGCGDDGGSDESGPRRSTSTSTEAEAETDPVSELADTFGAQLGALSTVRIYCIPGLPGSPREGCNLDRFLTGIGEMTTGMKEEIGAHPDPEAFADVSAAIDGLDAATVELGPCDTWFNSGGVDPNPTTAVACEGAWFSLTESWDALELAVGYGQG